MVFISCLFQKIFQRELVLAKRNAFMLCTIWRFLRSALIFYQQEMCDKNENKDRVMDVLMNAISAMNKIRETD